MLNKTIFGIEHISVTEEYIYAIYDNYLFSHDKQMKPNSVAVFDWQGNPITRYLLSDTFFGNIVVDQGRNRCYGMAETQDGEVVLAFFEL